MSIYLDHFDLIYLLFDTVQAYAIIMVKLSDWN